MAPPPAKRQKRVIVLSSDDDDDDVPVPPKLEKHEAWKDVTRITSSNDAAKQSLPTRSRTKPMGSIVKGSKSYTATRTTPTSLDASQKKSNRKSKASIMSQGSKPISTFFGAATQLELLHRQEISKATSPVVENEAEDLIEDDSQIQELDELLRAQRKIDTVLDRRKRQGKAKDNVPSGRRRFKMVGNATENDADELVSREDVHLTPWAERYGPSNLEELMVHKKKVSDVQTWLDNVMQGRDTKVCLPSIPSPFNN